MHDIENIVVAEQKGTPVRVKDVADVDIGYAPRLGIVGYNDDPDVVQGIVLMRYGGETPADARGHPQAASSTSATTTSCRRGWTSSRTTTAATW